MNVGMFEEISLDESKPLRASMDVSDELRAGSGASPLDAFFREVEDIQKGIQEADDLTSMMGDLRKRKLEDTTTSSEPEEISTKIQGILMKMKAKLQELINYCNSTAVEENDNQIRKTQVLALKERLVIITEARQRQEKMFKEVYKKRAIRQFTIANPDVNEKEIEQALEEGKMSFFSNLVSYSTRVDSAKDVLNNVEKMHEDIRKIIKSINVLHILFIDLQNMSEVQDNSDKKNRNLEVTNQRLDKSKFDLEAASKVAKSRRKKKFYLMAILALILIILIIAVVLYVLAPLKVRR